MKKQKSLITVGVIVFAAVVTAESFKGLTHIEPSQVDGTPLVTYASLTNVTASSRYYCSGDPLERVTATQARNAAMEFLDGLVQSATDWRIRGIRLRCFKLRRVEEKWLEFWHWQVLFVDTMFKSKEPYLSASKEEKEKLARLPPRLTIVVDMNGEVVPPEEE
jgi:hypothetical protein